PASVRPAPCTVTCAPSMRESASSSSPCTESPVFWRCHPASSVPSYWIVSLSVRKRTPDYWLRITGCCHGRTKVRPYDCTQPQLHAALRHCSTVIVSSSTPASRPARLARRADTPPDRTWAG